MSKPVKPTAPPIPQRTQQGNVFSGKVDQFLTYVPTAADYFEQAVDFVDGQASSAIAASEEAADSSAAALQSEQAAASSANFIGDWIGKTGPVPAGVSVRHNGAFWRSLVVIADIAASEPGVSADWAFVSGVRWTDLITSSQAVPANSQNNVQAISSDVDIALPYFEVNDFLVVHCTADSDSLCRILNPDYTIRGARGSISAGDDLTLQAGDTVHLVYVATNLLEVV